MDVKSELEKVILSNLNKQFGIEEIQLKFYVKGKNKIYAYYKNFELPNWLSKYCVHSGIYFGKLEKDGVRLSVDGSSLIGKYAKKGVLEVDDETAEKWMRGEDIEVVDKSDKLEGAKYVILKWREFYIGCGKVKIESMGKVKKIKNYVPKSRRIDSHYSTQQSINSIP